MLMTDEVQLHLAAEFLGFGKPIPPFASTATDDQEILMGVNYASGAAGIRDETGYQLVMNNYLPVVSV